MELVRDAGERARRLIRELGQPGFAALELRAENAHEPVDLLAEHAQLRLRDGLVGENVAHSFEEGEIGCDGHLRENAKSRPSQQLPLDNDLGRWDDCGMPGLADVKVTLYDIFGYLFPGLVALAGLGIFGWSLFWPKHPLHAFVKGGAGWFALIVTGYIVGHLVQAIANRLELSPEQKLFNALPEGLQHEVEAGTKVTGDAAGFWNYLICDTAIAQNGSTGDREIYQYREGFYRGLAVAFPIVVVALFVRLGRDGAAVKSGHTVHTLSSGVLWALAITAFLAAVLAWDRYRRFQKYKINNAFLGYLVLDGAFGQLPPPPPPVAG